MKKKVLISVLMLIVGFAMASAQTRQYESIAGDPFGARIYTLPNGLKVYLSQNTEKPRIQTLIAVRTGSRNDPAETTGLAHYLEHLMFKGTKQFGTIDAEKEKPYLDEIEAMYEDYRKMTDAKQRKEMYHRIDSVSQLAAKYNIPNEYDKLMSSIGAEGTNAYTSNDVTCYTEDIPANELDNWAKIQSDRFENMVIRGFHTELEAVYEEYNIGIASDGHRIWEALCRMLFPGHPYGTQTTIGTQDHLKNPSITNIKNYFKNYYCPNNVAICMSGDLDFDKTMAIVEKYFGNWKRNENLTVPQYAPLKPITSHRDTTIIGKEQETLYLAWRFDGAKSYQTDTLEVISDILSNGKAGLMDLDLEQTMKVLGAGAGTETLAEYGGLSLVGVPKAGQSLNEVRELLLGEIEKLKKGDFSDDLLPSVINNKKLRFYRSLENNRSRANYFVDAFINGQEWSDVVGSLDRISGMTKQQIVDFAQRHLNDNYIAIYKKQGDDTGNKKIDKPAITPIPSNRDLQSQFVKDIIASHADPIQPRFVNFETDMQKGTTKRGLPVMYVENKQNGIFNLTFRYEFGTEYDKRLDDAAEYLNYLGTDKLSAEQIKQQFYKLACSYNVSSSGIVTNVSLSGQSENMPEALALFENILTNAKVDKEAWANYTDLVLKARNDAKKSQRNNWNALWDYGRYGEYNPSLNYMSEKELKETNPQVLVDLIKGLKNYEHTVLYYGPDKLSDVIATIDKTHKTAKRLAPAPKGKEFVMETTPQNEVIIAPFNAKSILMGQYSNENTSWNPENSAVIELFNEYFGSGMNSLVFQELRETRGLAYSAAARYYTPSRKDKPEWSRTYISTQNDKMIDCINTFNEILDEMPQSQKAFDLAKQSLMKRLATERTTKTGIFNKYFSNKRLGIDYDIDEKIYNAIPKLQFQDIINFEKNHMANKTHRYIILGDEKELDMKALEKIGPIKRVTTEQIFGY